MTSYECYDTATSVMSMESETSDAHQLLKLLLDSVSIGALAVERTGKVTVLNDAASEHLSLKSADLSLTQWRNQCNFLSPDKVSLLSESQHPFAIAMRGETIDNFEVYVGDNRNSCRYLSVKCRPFLDASGVARGGLVMTEDITQLKLLSEEVDSSKKEFQEFAYITAHDLQEPLRSIIGFSELLQNSTQGAIEPKQKDYLRRITDASRHLQAQISGLLAFARIETRAKEPAVCDLNEIIDDVLVDLAPAINAKKASVEVCELPTVYGNRTQLAQLFQHLLSNSLKFSDENPSVKVSCKSDESMHHFRFADNGIGMDMQSADRIFAIFQRLNHRSQYEGVGIGLTLCKKIINKHGGQIWAESVIGEGTSVCFTLPYKSKDK